MENICEEKNKRYLLAALAVSVLIPLVYFFIIARHIHLVYAIVDDVMMRNIAAGVTSGVPDGHLIHIQYVLGVFLAFLYKTIPGIDWYGCSMVGIILASWMLILYRGVSDRRSLTFKIVYVCANILVFSCVILRQMAGFQFTVVAGIACGAALFFYYTSQPETKAEAILETGISIFFFGLSYCVRKNVCLMAMPLVFTACVYKNRKQNLKKIILFLGLLVGCILGIMLVEKAAYASPEWKAYREYNGQRSSLYDYYGIPEYEENQEFYSSIGMKEYEVKNLRRYSLYFIDDLMEEKIEKIANYAAEQAEQSSTLQEKVAAGVQKTISSMTDERVHLVSWATGAVAVLVLLLCIYKRGSYPWFILFVIGMELAIWFYLGYQGRLPARVGIALYLIEFFMGIAVLYSEWPEKLSAIFEKRKIIVCIILLPLAFGMYVIGNQEFRDVQFANKELYEVNETKEILEAYYKEHPENVYYSVTASTSFYTDNFKIRKNFDFAKSWNLGDWDTFSPVMKERQQRLGMENVPEAIMELDQVYVISTYEPDMLEAYYQDRYENVVCEEIEQIHGLKYRYKVFQFHGDIT